MGELSADDKWAIHALLAKYVVYMDRRDERWMTLFAPDASFEVVGQESLRAAAIEQSFRRAAPGLHLASCPIVESGPTEGSATATQTFLVRDAATEMVKTGWYEDELVREGGAWQFKVRRVNLFDD